MPESLRIVSLISSATEILYALGLSESIVAVSHECDFPAEAADKPKATFTQINVAASSSAIDEEVKAFSATGRALYGVDRELLASLTPDLIITQAQCDVCAVSHEEVTSIVADQEELSHTRVLALNPASLADVFADVHRIGQSAGCLAQAEEFVESLRMRVAAVRSQTESVDTPPPRVACIEWIEPLMIAANWVPELVQLAGGVHGMTRVGSYTSYADWSELVAYDPGVVIVAPCGFGLDRANDESAKLTEQPAWRQLRAVRSGRVFVVDGSAYFNRSGPRLVDTIELIAGLLRSDRAPVDKRFDAAWCQLKPGQVSF